MYILALFAFLCYTSNTVAFLPYYIYIIYYKSEITSQNGEQNETYYLLGW